MHPLQRQLGQLRRRLAGLLTLRAVSLVLAVALGAGLALGVVDYGFRFQDRGLRVMCWLALTGAAAWAGGRQLVTLLGLRFRDVDLAYRVQRRFPALGDRLASAVEFLDAPDAAADGDSTGLRRKVVALATADAAAVDFTAVIDRRPLRRAVAGLAVVAGCGVTLLALNPAAFRIAASRLVNPWNDVAWPRTTHLEVRRATAHVPRGQAFEIEVGDAQGRPLPAEVWIHYRQTAPDGTWTQQSQRMRPADGAVTARRDHVLQPFSYRIAGGDDHAQPWTAVDVIDPPALETLNVRLFPPAYTGWSPYDAPPQIHALAGTRIEWQARATRPLRAATLHLSDGRQTPAALSDGGRMLRIAGDAAVTVRQTLSYWFTLADRDTEVVDQTARWEIAAQADAPPHVVLKRPAQATLATARAVVPLHVEVQDDLAVRSVELAVGRTAGEGPAIGRVPLWTAPPVAAATSPAAPLNRVPPAVQLAPRWDLTPFNLAAGDELSIAAVAVDGAGQEATSQSRRITIVTPDELLERLSARQDAFRAELAGVLQLQRERRRQVTALVEQLGRDGRLTAADLDRLQAAELGQRQIEQRLSSQDDGLPARLAALREDLLDNRLDSPNLQRRIDGLLAELQRLGREDLAATAEALSTAVKALRVTLPAGDSGLLKPALEAAAAHQQRVIEVLQRLLGHLEPWNDYRRLQRDAAQLLRDQEAVSRRTAELAPQTLARELKDLPPRSAVELQTLAKAQLGLALRADQLQEELSRSGPRLRSTDVPAAETLAEAADLATRQGLAELMRSARESLERNQLGHARRGQQQIEQVLGEMNETLAGRRQRELARSTRRLRDAAAALETAAQQQADLRNRMQAAVEKPPAARRERLQVLGSQQLELEGRSRQLARQLAELQAQPAAAALEDALRQMHAAVEAAAGNAAAAAEHAAHAAAELEQARTRLRQHLAASGGDLAAARRAQRAALVSDLCARQEKLLAATRRIDQSRPPREELPSPAAPPLAADQQALEAATRRARHTLEAGPAAEMVLDRAADEMQQAALRLGRRETGAVTQQAQAGALRQLEVLRSAWADSTTEEPSAKAQTPGKPSPQADEGPPINPDELRVVRGLQAELARHVEQLERRRVQEPAATTTAAASALGHQQRQLAEVVARVATLPAAITRPAATAPRIQPLAPPTPAGPPSAASVAPGLSEDLQRSLFEPGTPPPAAAASGPLDEQLIREMGIDALPARQRPLAVIFGQMGTASRRLGQADTGPATQQLQQQIVDHLDQLLQAEGSGTSQSPPVAKSPAGKPDASAAAKESSGPPVGPPEGPVAAAAKPGTAAASGDLRSVLTGLWGELPPRMRDSLLQRPQEEFLPKYGPLLEEYYRRLAEPRGRGGEP